MELELVAIKDLVLDPNNARLHGPKNLKAISGSFDEFDQLKNIVIDTKNVVIAGNGTVQTFMDKGKTHIWALRSKLSDVKNKAFALADNMSGVLAEWDKDNLSKVLAELKDADFDLDNIGFDLESLDELGIETTKDGLIPDDEVPEVKESFVKRGEIWQLGNHRLMCGDSTSKEDNDKLMNGECSDFCFTSPPYSDQRDYGGGLDLSPEHLANFLGSSCSLFAVNLGMKRKDGEVVPYWDKYLNVAKQFGLKLLSWNVWDKMECGSVGNQTAMFGISHEWIFVLGKESVDLNRTVKNKSAGEMANHNGNRQKDGTVKKQKDRIVSDYSQLKTVLSLTPQKARDDIDHPARFPVELAETYIAACSCSNEIVYEPFTGSGSTLIACEKTSRKCYGMEIDPHYCGVIIERWQQFTGLKATKL
jgi:DNA modification methylase